MTNKKQHTAADTLQLIEDLISKNVITVDEVTRIGNFARAYPDQAERAAALLCDIAIDTKDKKVFMAVCGEIGWTAHAVPAITGVAIDHLERLALKTARSSAELEIVHWFKTFALHQEMHTAAGFKALLTLSAKTKDSYVRETTLKDAYDIAAKYETHAPQALELLAKHAREFTGPVAMIAALGLKYHSCYKDAAAILLREASSGKNEEASKALLKTIIDTRESLETARKKAPKPA